MSHGFEPEDVKDYRSLGSLGLGFSIVAVLLVCIVGGIFLDQYFDTAPILTLIGVVIGLVAAGYQLYELTLINQKDRQSGPLGRKIESQLSKRRRQ